MTISVVTPTCGRPEALTLTERMLKRQTLQPTEWHVISGAGRPPGVLNFLTNLLAGLEQSTGDVVLFVEDDDHYHATHVAAMARLVWQPGVLTAGDSTIRYYHVGARRYRIMTNAGSALCQTAIRREAVPMLQTVIEQCLLNFDPAVDVAWWRTCPRPAQALAPVRTVVGMKGLPGTPGLGIGHLASGPRWQPDPDGKVLRDWVGRDEAWYRPFSDPQAVASRVE